MEKVDFKKSLPGLYKPPVDRFVSVDVPAMQFVKIDGKGDPNKASAYKRAIEWLYPVSYAMKFAAKTAKGKDYVVPPLEGLWWADDPADFVARRKDRWCWTMMIMAPEFIDTRCSKPPSRNRRKSSASLLTACGLRGWRKEPRCKSCMSAATTTKGRPSRSFMTGRCRRGA